MNKILTTTIALCASLFSLQAQSSSPGSGALSCSADFSFKQNNKIMSLLPGIAYDFTSLSKGDNLTYFWDFGDGSTSTEATPMHLFNLKITTDELPWESRPFAKVTLFISNGVDCKDSISKYVPLWGDSAIQPVCSAWFEYYDAKDSLISIPEVKAVQFIGKSENKILQWNWFVDGQLVSTLKDPILSISMLMNSDYVTAGQMVVLKTLTTDSCETFYQQFIPWNNSSNSCYAYFKYYRNDSLNSDTLGTSRMRFFGYSESEVVSWHWDFGDGSTSDVQNPEHVYIIPPIKCGDMSKCMVEYNVCLTITTQSGCSNSYCEPIFPALHPSDNCNASFTNIMSKSLPPIFHFQNTSSWAGGTVFWDFGDGTVSTEANPSHVFQANQPVYDSLIYYIDMNESPNYKAGYYNVCLTISDGTGCSSTYCESIYSYTDTSYAVCPNFIKINTSSILGIGSCKSTASAELVDVNGNKVTSGRCVWSNGQIGSEATNLCPNEYYSVSIADENGCVTAGSFAITDYTQSWNPGYWNYEGKDSSYIFTYNSGNTGYNVDWIFSDGGYQTGDYIRYTFDDTKDNWVILVTKNSAGEVVEQDTIMLPALSSQVETAVGGTTFKLYPIPVESQLNVQLSNAVRDGKIEIVDITGKVLIDRKLNSVGLNSILNTDNLPKGLYICRIRTANEVLTSQKFIK